MVVLVIAIAITAALLVVSYRSAERQARAWHSLEDSLIPPEQVLAQVVEAQNERKVEKLRELGAAYGMGYRRLEEQMRSKERREQLATPPDIYQQVAKHMNRSGE